MMELMVVHPHIFWLSLGGLLLAAEMPVSYTHLTLPTNSLV